MSTWPQTYAVIVSRQKLVDSIESLENPERALSMIEQKYEVAIGFSQGVLSTDGVWAVTV